MRKTNVPGFVKDETSGLVINTNLSDLDKYRSHRNAILENKELKKSIKTLEIQFQDLLKEVRETLKGNK